MKMARPPDDAFPASSGAAVCFKRVSHALKGHASEMLYFQFFLTIFVNITLMYCTLQ